MNLLDLLPGFSPSNPDQWAIIKHYPRYAVSKDGRIYSSVTDKELRPYTNESNRYLVVELFNADGSQQRYVHRLVMQEHGPDEPSIYEEYEVDHENGDTKDNRLQNLQWKESDENSGEEDDEDDDSLGFDVGDAAPF